MFFNFSFNPIEFDKIETTLPKYIHKWKIANNCNGMARKYFFLSKFDVVIPFFMAEKLLLDSKQRIKRFKLYYV